jgi:cold shock CspA family protein/ribosome-associated translation inhibitor RaiA
MEVTKMRLPLQISFRNMPHSEAVERAIVERAERLERFSDQIMGCRVVVETRHHRHQGNLYHVRIDLTLPGHEIVVGREPALHHAFEDVYVAVRDAFDAARRRLEDYARRCDQRVKVHESPPHGHIARLDYGKNHGFIETPDGREIYFHRNSVLNADFCRLEVGDSVWFNEEAGEKGPQASSVHMERKVRAAG